MKNKIKYLIYCLVVFIFYSCNENKELDQNISKSSFKKIILDDWNESSIEDVFKLCNLTGDEYNLKENPPTLNKDGDTVQLMNHFSLFISERRKFINTIKKSNVFFEKDFNELVIVEKHKLAENTIDDFSSFYIFYNNKDNYLFEVEYTNDNGFSLNKRQKSNSEDYNLVDNAKCINEINGRLSFITIKTVFSIGENNKLIYTTENVYLGE